MSKIKNIFLSLILVGAFSSSLLALPRSDVSTFESASNAKTGIVNLSWIFPSLTSDTTVYIEYNVTNVWTSTNNAQIIFQVSSTTASESSSATMSLPVNVGCDDTSAFPASDYYFHVWIEDSSGLSAGIDSGSGPTPITTPATHDITDAILPNGATVVTLIDNSGQNSKLAIDNDGNTYSLSSLNTGDSALVINKFTPANTLAWTRYYANDSKIFIGDIAVDSGGNVYVTGSEYINSNTDIFLLKYNASGNVIFHRNYTNTPYNDNAKDIALDSTDNIYITGKIADGASYDMWLGKYDDSGNLSWYQTYNSAGTNSDEGTGVAIDNIDNVIVVGREDRYDLQQNANIFVRKYSPAGALLWAKTYNNSGNGPDVASGVAIDNIGNIVIAGMEDRYDGQKENIWLAKYDTNSGSLLWTQTHNGGYYGPDDGYAIASDDFGDIYVAGGVFNAIGFNDGSNTMRDLWIGKYDPMGNLMESKIYNSTSTNNDNGYDIAISSMGEVFVSAQFGNVAGIYRYSQQVTTGAIESSLSAYPGPNTGSVGLSWNYDMVLPSGSAYYIQYSTNPGVVWSTSTAQIVVSTAVPVIGVFQNETIRDLMTSRGANEEITSPNYYFQVWTFDGADYTPLVGTATTSAKTPFVNLTMIDFPNGGGMGYLNTQNSDAGVPVQDANGDFYYAFGGDFESNQAIAIQKYSNDGNLAWTTFYNSSTTIPMGQNAKYQIYGLTIDANGNLYLAGTEKNNLGNKNAFLGKFDLNGYNLWTKVFGSADYEDLYASVAVSPDSNKVYVVGSVSDGDYDIRIATYSSDGLTAGLIDVSTNTLSNDEEAYGIDVDAAGNIYVAGNINNGQDIWLAKFDSVGSQQWATTYDSSNNDIAMDIKISTSGAFVYIAGKQGSKALVGKFNASNGDKISTATYSYSWPSKVAVFQGLALDKENGVYVAGYQGDPSEDPSLGGESILIKKYSSDLHESWMRVRPTNANNPSNDEAQRIIIDRTNNDVLAGIKIGVDSAVGFIIFPQPNFNLVARQGNSIGSVDLNWTSKINLPIGTTYYVQYSTFTEDVDWSAAAAQIVGMVSDPIFQGNRIDLTVTGLEAGLNGQNMPENLDYYFRVWVSTDTGINSKINTIPTAGYAYVPPMSSNSFVYPNSKLFVTNGANNNRNGIAKDSSGNIYTVARFYDQNNQGGSFSIIIKKTTYDGVPLWTRFYGAPEDGNVKPHAIAVDDSGVYVSGHIEDPELSQGIDALLVKYSPTGEFLWKRTHNGDDNDNDYAYDVTIDGMGFVYAAGSEYVSGENNNVWLGKYSSTGAFVWQWNTNVSGDGNSGAIYAVAISTNNNIWLAGTFYNGSDNDSWYALVRNEGTPNLVGSPGSFSNDGDDAIYDIAVDSQNYAYLVGKVYVENQDSDI